MTKEESQRFRPWLVSGIVPVLVAGGFAAGFWFGESSQPARNATVAAAQGSGHEADDDDHRSDAERHVDVEREADHQADGEGHDRGMAESHSNGLDSANGAAGAAEESQPHTDTGLAISDQARRNIGLQMAPADFRSIDEVIRVNGIVRAHPDSVAFVNTRIPGRVKRLYAKLGDYVSAGQKLAEIESRQFGDPIPSVLVYAPFSGRVVQRATTLGASVDPSAPLFKLMSLASVIVEGDVFESYVASLRLGQRVRVRLPAFPEKTFVGKIVFISDTLDPDKRTANIWVHLDNPKGLLKPEMFAELSIVVASRTKTLVVPRQAVVEDGPESVVFVEHGGLFQKTPVTTGLKDDVFIEIRAGLEPGQKVVVRGNHELFAFSRRPETSGVQDESKPHAH